MGHERVGRLPKTHRWISIVAAVAQAPSDAEVVKNVATVTLANVRDRLANIQRDHGVQAAFQYLVALAQPSDTSKPPGVVDLRADPSPLRIAASLNSYVDRQGGSLEYSALAKHAAADAIAEWTRRGSTQGQLFTTEQSAAQLWESSANGGDFSEIARLFFSRFVERYVKYFLDREASAVLPTVEDRDQFDRQLKNEIGKISRHAFETSKITQSFAAGWYNKNAKGSVPSAVQVRTFLSIAFGKLREELRREEAR